MKRGANQLSEIDNTNHKKKKIITKTLDVLLQDVNAGNFEDFRSFLIQNNMKILDLYNKCENTDLMQLGLALKDTQVHTLNLNDNNIGADGAASLGVSLKDTQIHTLNLGDNNIGADGSVSLAAILKDTKIHTLFLGSNNIGDDGAASLGASLKDTQINTLDLTSNNIGDDGAASLGAALKDTQVHTIDLGYNNIGDAGAASLGAALKDTQIHTLDLEFNNIGDAGAARLAATLKDTQLNTLYLGFNNIGPEGEASLAACIPDTLLFNVIVDVGFENEELEAALKKNHWEKRLAPYYIASLQHVPENEKNQYYNLPQASAKTAALTFAGGIFMALGQKGFSGEGLQNKILSYLPSVSPTLAYQYQLATAQAENKIQALNAERMDVERSDIMSCIIC